MSNTGLFPQARLRRLRKNSNIRSLVRKKHVDLDKLIFPLFIKHGTNLKKLIPSMPGQYQLSIDQLSAEITTIMELGIKNVILFGIPEFKNSLGTDAYSESGIIQTAIPVIKNIAPNLLVISDVCFCEYMDHGHCGVITSCATNKNPDVDVDNDRTLELLAKQAVSHAQAGADIIAPSGNMDGMVITIRESLDEAGYQHIPILSYSVKYASSMYGPFRQAAEGAPKFGDRKSYQMDYSNPEEALRECELDVAEGADMLMVKPAHTYLDIIHRIKTAFPHLPLGAYHTSGEFAMIKAAAEKGWINEKESVLEILSAIHRAGADFIITYYAKNVAEWLAESDTR